MADEDEHDEANPESDWRQQNALALERLINDWKEAAPDFALDQNRLWELKRLLHRFSEQEIHAAMFLSVEIYVYRRQQTYGEAWERIGGVCYNSRNDQENPEQATFRHWRNLLRSRFGARGSNDDDYSDELAFEHLDLAERRGIELKSLEGIIRNAPTFSHFTRSIIERVRASNPWRHEDDEDDEDNEASVN